MTTRQMQRDLLAATQALQADTPIEVFSTILEPRVFRVPGITVASTYTTNDAFGTLFVIGVPKEGTIANVVFLDYDKEAINKELVIFNQAFTATADHDAFAPTDIDLRHCVGVAYINTWSSFNVNAIGQAIPALSYYAPEGKLYCQLVTKGADNIAATAIPDLFVVVV